MDEAVFPFSTKALYQRLHQSMVEQEQSNAALEENGLENEGGDVNELEVRGYRPESREVEKRERGEVE